MEELKDLNQQFEDRHGRALDLYRRGEYAAAIEEWKVVLTLCAGRAIQEQSVISGIVEASVRLEEYGEAVRMLGELIARKRERGLSVPAGLLERMDYLKSLARTSRPAPNSPGESSLPGVGARKKSASMEKTSAVKKPAMAEKPSAVKKSVTAKKPAPPKRSSYPPKSKR